MTTTGIVVLKALAFVPLNYFNGAYEQLKNERPSSPKVEDFIWFFDKTWVNGEYPINLWNHYDNNGPRTNNHLEGDNRKTNIKMPYNKNNNIMNNINNNG